MTNNNFLVFRKIFFYFFISGIFYIDDAPSYQSNYKCYGTCTSSN